MFSACSPVLAKHMKRAAGFLKPITLYVHKLSRLIVKDMCIPIFLFD